MAVTTTLTNLPTPPQSTDPANFSTRADAFVTALDSFQVEMNSVISEVNSTETSMNTSEDNAVNAALAAVSAANFKGTWSSATSYAIGDSVVHSGIIYRAILAGSNQNPSTATTYWVALSIASSIAFTPTGAIAAVNVQTALAELDSEKAPLASPALTGTPTAPTPSVGDNDTSIATTAFVQGEGFARLVRMTAQATTSGTSIDFTIPANVKRIAIMLNQVSGSGTSPLAIQIGDSGGIETTGYLSTVTYTAAGVNNTSMFQIQAGLAASDASYGAVYLENMSGNVWVESANISATGQTAVRSSTGIKELSATLTTVRLTTVNGTDTFDGGSVNVMYEY